MPPTNDDYTAVPVQSVFDEQLSTNDDYTAVPVQSVFDEQLFWVLRPSARHYTRVRLLCLS